MDSIINIDKTGPVAGMTSDKARCTTSSASLGGAFERLSAAESRRGATMARRLDVAVLPAEAEAGAADIHGGQGASHKVHGARESAPHDRSGVTRNQLEARLERIRTDSERYAWISGLLANFDTADANGDGKINGREAQAFRRAYLEERDLASVIPPSGTAATLPPTVRHDGQATNVRQIPAYSDTTHDEGGIGLSLTT